MILNLDSIELSEGIKEIQKRLRIAFKNVKSINAQKGESDFYSAQNGDIKITYSSILGFYHSLGRAIACENSSGRYAPSVQKLGVLLDCARNGVLETDSLYTFIVIIALMGYSYLNLYVEDCFEVDNEPYFGYMRGRYSKDDLKAINAFCQKFGIELIPCIQTLAHLAQIFMHWEEYASKIRDKGDVLLVGEERTYQLIENMIATCRECFASTRINIGMDEAFELGKGKYFDLHGYKSRREIMYYHLERVVKICQKYNFTPLMWGDMFYEDVKQGKLEDILRDVNLIYWNYLSQNEADYESVLSALKERGISCSFAGACHKWYGFAPLNEYSQNILDVQIKVVQKYEIQDFLLTLWGDDGAECSHFSALPTIAYLAQQNDQNAPKDFADKILLALTGYSFKEFNYLDSPNKLFDGPFKKRVNPSKYLFYVDPFLGIEEFTVRLDYPKRYRAAALKLRELSKRKSDFAYLFKNLSSLCFFLEYKSTLTQELDIAYKSGDKALLKHILKKRMPKLKKYLKQFISDYKRQWQKDCRPQGFEVQQYRLYGLLGRLICVQERLNDYLKGKIDKIVELEENKVIKPKNEDEEYNACRLYNRFTETVTYGAF